MKKSKVLVHLREIIGDNILYLSIKTGVPENHIHDMELGLRNITMQIITYYSSSLHVDIEVMKALLGDFEKKHYIFEKLQNSMISILLVYLDFSKWMFSFNEKIKE